MGADSFSNILVYHLPVSVDEVNYLSSFQVFPNPAHEEIFIDERVTKFNLKDLTDRTVLLSSKRVVDISFLSKGMYIMEAVMTDKILLKKLLIE